MNITQVVFINKYIYETILLSKDKNAKLEAIGMNVNMKESEENIRK